MTEYDSDYVPPEPPGSASASESEEQRPVYGYPPSQPSPEPAVPPVYPGYYEQAAPPQAERRGGGNGVGIVLIAALVALIVAGIAGLAGGFIGAQFADSGTDGVLGMAKVQVVPSKTTEPVVAAAAAAVPSVVNIDVRAGTSSGGEDSLPQDHPTVPMIGNGSGVAYKRVDGGDGGTYIITNNHVVEGAEQLTVRDVSGKSAKATLVGRDPETDIAVIKVSEDLPVIDTGQSADLIVGQTVVAIGSPFGLEHSVTSGVVSALGRSLTDFTGSSDGAYPLVDVIQTDAAINPGNSGGALVDRGGKLIGINTAIYSDSGASGGIGFAVPVDTAKRVADQLIEGGSITHPFIGVVGQSVTPEFAQQQELSVQEGAYVAEVTEGSGAAKADIQKGDVITEVDGEAIRTMDDLILQVRRKKVGDTVTLTVVRGDETLEVQVEVGDKPADLSLPSEEQTNSAPGQ
ncbi:MAG TPA: trypsin-like peptidase domain-containing protein [Coriobacteriia bacterium]|nr:trypsin-like peptidase domain-containing protein [Coriobacteriia bacterium]